MRRQLVRICILWALAGIALAQDTKYQPAAGPREYRQSIDKLYQCASALRSEKTSFVIQLGDLIDGGLDNLNRILPVFEKIQGSRYSVLGNHDFSAGRDVLLKRLSMPAANYDFGVHGWRFVVLDGMQQSVGGGWPQSDPHYRAGRETLDRLEAERAINAKDWDGALGPQQREWLHGVLAKAAQNRERAIVFCHFPVLAESCRPEHLLWDHRQVLDILESAPALIAYMNGHDHRGGYAEKGGIHYVTFSAMVEHDAAHSCNVVDVYPDRLVLRNAGSAQSRQLKIRPAR
jgi:hypothetical protein